VLRGSQQGTPSTTPAVVRCGEIAIDLLRRRVTVRDEVVKLTATEFRFLQQLALKMDKVQSHTDLLTRVWGPE